MCDDLKYFDGSVQRSRACRHLKALFATAFEIEPKWLIGPPAAARSGSTRPSR